MDIGKHDPHHVVGGDGALIHAVEPHNLSQLDMRERSPVHVLIARTRCMSIGSKVATDLQMDCSPDFSFVASTATPLPLAPIRAAAVWFASRRSPFPRRWSRYRRVLRERLAAIQDRRADPDTVRAE